MYLFTDEKGNKLEITEFFQKGKDEDGYPGTQATRHAKKLQKRYGKIILAWSLLANFNDPIQ